MTKYGPPSSFGEPVSAKGRDVLLQSYGDCGVDNGRRWAVEIGVSGMFVSINLKRRLLDFTHAISLPWSAGGTVKKYENVLLPYALSR